MGPDGVGIAVRHCIQPVPDRLHRVPRLHPWPRICLLGSSMQEHVEGSLHNRQEVLSWPTAMQQVCHRPS